MVEESQRVMESDGEWWRVMESDGEWSVMESGGE